MTQMPELIPVEPFHDDVLEHGYRACDYCHESAVDDIYVDRQWRKFYKSTDTDQLTVCGNCKSRHLNNQTI